jgi:anti-anti-sigma factor
VITNGSIRGAHVRIEVAHDGVDERRVVVEGDLDLSSVGLLAEQTRMRTGAASTRLEIDLSRTAFMDSMALRTLLALRDDSLRRGLELRLVPGPRAVQRVFELTRTTELFDWSDGRPPDEPE